MSDFYFLFFLILHESFVCNRALKQLNYLCIRDLLILFFFFRWIWYLYVCCLWTYLCTWKLSDEIIGFSYIGFDFDGCVRIWTFTEGFWKKQSDFRLYYLVFEVWWWWVELILLSSTWGSVFFMWSCGQRFEIVVLSAFLLLNLWVSSYWRNHNWSFSE
jgi:hypothetical protein